MELAQFLALTEYLNDLLSGFKVESCHSLAPGVVALELEKAVNHHCLLLGVHPLCTGLVLQSNVPSSTVSTGDKRFNPRFARALAHTVQGFTLRSIELPRKDDRIARFIFNRTDRYGDTKTRLLQLELTGRTSQLFLLNEHEQLISSLRRLDYKLERTRSLKAGKELPPPPPPPAYLRRSEPDVRESIDVASILAQEAKKFALFLEGPSQVPLPRPKVGDRRRERLLSELELVRKAEGALEVIGSAKGDERILSALRKATDDEFVKMLQERGHLVEPVDLGRLIRALQRMASSRGKLSELLASVPVKADYSPKVATDVEEAPAYASLAVRLKAFPHKARAGTTSSGFQLILTFSAEGNYAALRAFGRPEHWFFHARDFPGSYVLLLTGKQKPKPADIRQAALVAAVHSKGKREVELDVSYTQLKYVRKPKSARVGTVLMTREQVIPVRIADWEEVKAKVFGRH